MTDTPEDHWWDEENKEAYEELRRRPELVRLFLYMSGLQNQRQLPELARSWLVELVEVGLPELNTDQEAPLKQVDAERPVLDPREGELYPVRIGNHRQMIWIKLDGPRAGTGDQGGYRTIEVLDKPLRTQTGIIALLTALEAKPIDVVRLREALSQVEPSFLQSIDKGPGRSWWSSHESDEESNLQADEERDEQNSNLQIPMLRYVLALLQYYRPSFDELPHQEQLGLIEQMSVRVNKLLTASRQLVGFLEYGVPGKDLRVAAEDADRDIKATMLTDVEGLDTFEVAKRLGIETNEDTEKSYATKHEHKAVVKMIERGRKIIEGALGKEGWQRQIVAMKVDAEQFRKLSTKDQAIQTLVDDNIPVEEARRQVEEAKEKRLGGWVLPGDPYSDSTWRPIVKAAP